MNKDSKTISAKSVALIFLAVCAILAAVLLYLFIPGANQLEDPTSVTTGTYGESTAVTTEATATTTDSTTDNTTDNTTDSTTAATEPELSGPEPGSITYEEYMALPVEEQQAYYYRFESPDVFFQWLDAAKKEYESENTPTTTPSGENENPTQGGVNIDGEDVEDWE